MPKLEALYLSHNSIAQVEVNAFKGLTNLIHLDLSRNFYHNKLYGYNLMSWAAMDVLRTLRNLASLDFSFTRLSNANILSGLGKKFQRLSLCYTGLPRLRERSFENTTLRILDVSGNNGILGDFNSLRGLENSLEILYADSVNLQNVDMLFRFEKMEILKVSNNEINGISEKLTRSWTNTQIVDLDNNRLISWSYPLFSVIPNLKLLSLKNNNINIISEEIIHDLAKISYIALSGNFFFCNCHSREFFDIAVYNEKRKHKEKKDMDTLGGTSYCLHPAISFHNSFIYYNNVIDNRNAVESNCASTKCRTADDDFDAVGNFALFDYNDRAYECFMLDEDISVHFSIIPPCNQTSRGGNVDDVIRESKDKIIALIVIPIVILPFIAVGYVFRRTFKYFIITMRNSAMLSMINKIEHKDGKIFFNTIAR